VNVRPRFGAHPRLAILGLLEARLLQADLVILGGLNEGTWPPEPADDPWLSRPMRTQFGLPPAERRIGLTAHDFVQAASGRDVVLTRARKVDGTPTVPARWLLRLDALLAGDDRWAAATSAPELGWGAALDWPASTAPVTPPAPRPPVAARPRKLSVTRIEAWIRDPYAIYARYILQLKPLDDLDAPADALMRGTAIHKALEDFVNAKLPPDAARLERMLEQNFGELLERPMVRAFWRPRLARIATWFTAYEIGRRAAGTVTVATESKGVHVLTGLPGGDFELSGTGDRIDRLADGSLAILDYKTGRAPSMKEVLAGLNPQLTLEAAIAAAGGFPGVPAAPVSELTYVRVTGNEPPGEELTLEFKRDKAVVPTADVAQEALAALGAWVTKFDDPDTPYRSRPRPQFLDYDGDYDLLARVREWAANGGGE
jgi:ATP-dependent helicase/nuclease subunit B